MHKRASGWIFALAAFLCSVALLPTLNVANAAEDNKATSYYSDQLDTAGAKAIYSALVNAFEQGNMQDGKTDVNITSAYVSVNPNGLKNYIESGDRQLFRDFSDAKDAFDLEHPEAWYVDSSFLTLRTGKTGKETSDEAQDYMALIGAGRENNYYLNGQETYKVEGGTQSFGKESIQSMDKQYKSAISAIVDKVAATQGTSESVEDTRVAKIKAAHDAIIDTISYRFENEATKGKSLFVRTAYGVVTHEGMCEAYARAFQAVMNDPKVNIPCVLIAGMQISGDNPEQHMWVYVDLHGNGAYKGEDSDWYGVDITWDDPVKYDENGLLVKTKTSPEGLEVPVTDGLDGRETSRYLLVGSNTLTNWVPGGQFSQDGRTFELPTISATDYSGGEAFNQGGLSVKYTSTSSMEDNTAAGTFTVSYNGMSAREAAEKQGVYILLKMIDLQDDGTVYTTTSSQGDEWYYAEASLALLNIASEGKPNPFFCDVRSDATQDESGAPRNPGDPGYLRVTTSGCDYVEFAVTTQKPKNYETWWSLDWHQNILVKDISGLSGYYHGDDSGVLNQTGELYNVNGTYTSQPYVYTQTPPSNSQVSTGTHMAKVIYDDALTFKGAAEIIKDALQWDDSSATSADISKVAPPKATPITIDEKEQEFQATQNDRFVTYTDAKGETKEYVRVPESEAHFTKGENLGVWGTTSGASSKASGNHGEGTNTLQVAYKCYQKDVEGCYLEHTLQGKVKFDDNSEEFNATQSAGGDHSSRNWNADNNADGFVDSDTPHFNWIFECNVSDKNHQHVPYGQTVKNNRLQPGEGCRLVGVEFEFDASDMWADDLTHYQFQIVGASTNPNADNCVVGMRSSKPANTWQYLISSPMCPFAYASMGIDFSLWARPSLMDNPNDLDLSQFTATDRNGKVEDLQQLADDMNLDYINGKLMLVVEDISDKRGQVSELEKQLDDAQDIPNDAIKSRSVYDLNFANICKSTIAKVEKGAEEGDVSMRVQVGFPPGYGPENAGVVFKAYHFDRDENGKVTGVQEIPVVVTEYGLLIMCDRFSPFEIVALDASNEQVKDALQDDSLVHNNDLLVSTDGHVTVTANGEDVSSGAKAIVHMHDDDRKEAKESTVFTITPDPGFEIQGVTFNGGVRDLTDDGGSKTLTITKQDMESIKRGDDKMGTNTILAVTSIPSTVKQQNESVGMQTSMPATCNHQGVEITKSGEAKKATCTQDGHIQGQECSKCHTVLVQEADVPATGHTAVTEQTVTQAPTCTEAGRMDEVKCKICGSGVAIAAQSIPATGHAYDAGGVCEHINNEKPCGEYLMEKDTILPANIEALKAGLSDEASYEQDNYTPETWSTYESAVNTAKGLLNKYNSAITTVEQKDPMNPGVTTKVKVYNANKTINANTKTEVANATTNLSDAELKLVKKPTDFSALQELVNDVQLNVASAYTPESWAKFNEVLTRAQQVLTEKTADQESVDALVKELTKVEAELVPAAKAVDRTKLQALIKQVENLVGDVYTSDTWTNFQTALDEARKVVVREGASQAEIDAAAKALEDAQTALKLAPVETPSTAALETLISDIESLSSELYTQDSWAKVESLVSTIKQALSSGKALTVQEIENYFSQLTQARSELKDAPLPNHVELAQLKALSEKASKLHSSMYTPDTWNAFQTALAEAQAAVNAGSASPEELLRLYDALAEAERSLVPVTVEHPSTAVLDELLSDIASLDSGAYTKDSWSALQKVVDQIKGQDLTKLSAEQIDSLYAQLRSAYEGLSVDTSHQPGEGLPGASTPSKPGTQDGPSGSPSDTPDTPKTVDLSKLQELVDECDGISKNGYTFDSLYRFIVALRNAHNGLSDPAITQGRANRLYDQLLAAKNGLVASLWNQPSQSSEVIEIYRLYNPYSGEHLFSSDANERDVLSNSGWTYEGVSWKSPTRSTAPVYRLYNAYTGEHHYTADLNERNVLVLRGWNAEGIGWYSDVNQGVAVYRLFNPYMNGAPGSHHYTTDQNEYNVLPSHGWNQEDIAFYGVAA